MNRELRAVLFDLDDTLHDDTLAFTSAADEVAREIAAEHGIDAAKLKASYVEAAEGFWHRLSTEQLETKMQNLREQLWSTALGGVGIDDATLARRSARNYNDYRRKHFALYPGALDLLRELHARGIKLGIVTNGFSETHRDKIAVLQIAEYFDGIFMPDETGMIKPDPLLFAHACERLGATPAQSAMVGDRYERDIVGAQLAGFFTVWVNVRGETLPPQARAPDLTVASIGQLEALLMPLLDAGSGQAPARNGPPV